jgi:hypothetical protein
MDNVPAIVPLLEREHRVAENRLGTSKKELDDLATDKLKVNWHMRNQRYACTAQHHAVGNALYPPQCWVQIARIVQPHKARQAFASLS